MNLLSQRLKWLQSTFSKKGSGNIAKLLKDFERRIPKLQDNLFNIIVAFFLLLFSMPQLVEYFAPTGDSLDTSWIWMLGYGFQQKMQWGESILFTYGPLGYLGGTYFYSNHMLWGVAAIIRLITWLVFGLVYIIIFKGTNKTGIWTFPIVIAWIFGARLTDLSTQSAFTGVLLLAYSIQQDRSRSSCFAVTSAGCLLAFGALIKSTGLIVALFIVLIYPLLWRFVYQSKRSPLPPFFALLSFSLFFSFFFLLAGQHLSGLSGYIKGTYEIATGYTQAMSLHGNRLQTIAALAILLMFIVTGLRYLIQKNRIVVAQLLIFGVMLFWAWKEGFTRHDPVPTGGHSMIFYGIALLVSGIVSLIVVSSPNRTGFSSIAVAYLIAFIFSLVNLGNSDQISNYESFLSLMSSHAARDSLQISQDNAIRNQFRISPDILTLIQGKTVDVIPWDVMMAQGYQMNLIPSPIFQAYSAYTPYLDQKNANQLLGKGAAQTIIYTFTSIDGRYPIFDEPATFRAMLNCYSTEYAGQPYSIFSRSGCRTETLVKRNIVNADFGHWIPVVPEADNMDVRVRTTLFGQLMNEIYKPAEVYISFKLSNGSIKGPFRFICQTGSDGLFVKYFISDQSDINKLFKNIDSELAKISAFKLTTAPHSIDYQHHFSTIFYQTILGSSTPLSPETALPLAHHNF